MSDFLKLLMQMKGREADSPSNYDEKEQEKEEARRKKACDCGYNPHSDENSSFKEERCSVKLALRNHLTFPSFQIMSEYEDPSMLYYREGGMGFEPSRHWATLIDIYQDRSFIRPGCMGFNQFGEKVAVHFYHDNGEEPKTFNWSNLKPGNTLVILYPERKTFFDLSEGIREENLDSCFIFNVALQEVQDEAQKLLRDADINTPLAGSEKESSVCFNCGIASGKLSQCGACKLAKYCSKECQTKAWKSGHKKICKHSETLLRLAVLPRYGYKGKHFSFDENSKSYLMPYKQISTIRNQKTRY